VAHEHQIAPTAAEASIAITVSGTLGIYAAIVSPGFIPSFLNVSASLVTCSYNSLWLSSSLILSSPRKIIAGAEGAGKSSKPNLSQL
jgi:hypothetical protein